MNQPTTQLEPTHNLRDYTIITLTYWVFTLTDGAIRMLILLYLYQQGYAPLEIASLFLFYEFFGVVTNLTGGWIGAKFGLKATLFYGLLFQIIACLMLTVPASFLTLLYVMIAQGLCGIAKDLTKMSAKSYIKLVVPEDDQSSLMKWVAILTGSKNALKGVGFFLGGLLLTLVGLQGACLGMAIMLALALILSTLTLPRAPGKSKSKVNFRSLFSKDPRLNYLSAARLFLFGSRDIWFVLALPIYLSAALGWSSSAVGAFLALWIIGYGIIQASAPKLLHIKKPKTNLDQSNAPTASTLAHWTITLLIPLLGITAALYLNFSPLWTLIVGLALFGIVFAFNSAIHSYLVIHYAESDKIALNVGFYYTANAAGRLVGTLFSGWLFQLAGQGQTGLITCIIGSLVFVIISFMFCSPLQYAERNFSATINA